MQRHILKINIQNEQDVVLAYRRAMQLSEKVGMAMASQTKFATAVSEICRNVLEHVGSGSIQFNLTDDNGLNYLEAVVTDRGRGIYNPEAYLQKPQLDRRGRGSGIYNSQKLVDNFWLESELEKGTKVTLQKKIPINTPYISKAEIEQWVAQFYEDKAVSPYVEMKRQNVQLLELLEELRIRNEQTEQQLQEIQRLNQELQQANQDLDAFAHTVSHDLRSPLQNIGGLVTVLEACLQAEDVAEANEVFPLLREQAAKMDRLITGILSYSLAGRQNIKKERVDVQIVLHEVLTSLQIPNSFRVEIQPELPVLKTEGIYLHQVFSNLISNAVKYHDKPEQATIQVSFEQYHNFIQFTVKDNGPGIPKQEQEIIFNLYESVGNSVNRSDSSGIGLSIVKKIVPEKGGNVWVESEGRGSAFV
ncbi:MAG: ATP-binding protein, partial [Hymenobacteraceae bacterium]|nr:ATP-binding protein [Hymenobacteraceae bacterium]MDX5397794.1 ATP-binding protein [Hymenobacteraceae bacterium]MDX5513873.1 ATP-binding protein [Hymenobacteraceae bacterium]